MAAGLSTACGAIIPVLPFFWMHGMEATITAGLISLAAHFLVGASKALVTLRSWWASGIEMTLVGLLVGSVAFGAGILFAMR